MCKFIAKPILYLVIIVSLFISSTTTATVKAATGQLSLMATLDGKPAFRTVLWKLTPNSNNTSVSTIHIRKHAATLDLEPGSYQISVSLEGKTHTYYVTIKENSKEELIVSLD